MKFKSIALALFAICIVNEVSATFNLCGNNEEVDVCTTCNRARRVTAPKPHPLQRPSSLSHPLVRTVCRTESVQGPKPFDPIGDICSCGKQIIKPAPLPNIPRPSCLPSLPSLPRLNFGQSCNCAACNAQSQSNSPASSDCGHAVRAPEEYQIHNNKGATIYLQKPKSKAAHPVRPSYGQADVVSVAIARQLANKARNSVSEKQLQYGSLKVPTIPENEEQKVFKNIHEESIFDTRGEILEIKSNKFHKQQVVSSESESSEEEEVKKPKIHESFSPAQLKYDQIGYAVYQPSNKPRYVVVKNSETANHDCSKSTTRRPHHRHSFRRTGSCGCNKDLVVDQSEISEQSVSFENNSDQYLMPRGRLST